MVVAAKKKSSNLLLILTLAAVISGVIVGIILRRFNFDQDEHATRLIGFPGEIFMNMLKSLLLPLVSASMITGLAQLDRKTSGKLGTRAFIYYSLTTIHAVLIGVFLALLIKPGVTQHTIAMNANTTMANSTDLNQKMPSASDKLTDLVRNMFSENMVRSAFNHQRGNYTTDGKYQVEWHDNMNVLGIITISIMMGIAISHSGEAGLPLAKFFESLDAVVIRMMTMVMWFGPIGIPSMIAQMILKVENLSEAAEHVFYLIFTVILGLIILSFVTLPLIYVAFVRRNPFRFMMGLYKCYLNGFATSSSASVLPITSDCLYKMGLDMRVIKFVLPVGTVLNTTGTALFEAIGPIFIAQLYGVELNIGKIVTIVITASLASLGAASTPSAGLVTMMLVLQAVGLDSNIAIFLTIDWLLDRLRVCTNLSGVTIGCAVVNELSRNDLEQLGNDRNSTSDDELSEKY